METIEEPQEDTNNNDNNMLLLSISNRESYPQFYDWIEQNGFVECKYPNEEPYYLKYLHEKANFYSMTKGKKYPDTINAIRTLQEKRAMTSEGIIIEA